MADRAVPDAFANDLTGVYATDPDYGANLIAIMKLYNLYRFDGPTQSAQPQAAQASASATSTPARRRARLSLTGPRRRRPRSRRPPSQRPRSRRNAGDGRRTPGTRPTGRRAGGQATIPGLGAPALAPAVAHPTAAAHPAAAPSHRGWPIPPRALMPARAPRPARRRLRLRTRPAAPMPGAAPARLARRQRDRRQLGATGSATATATRSASPIRPPARLPTRRLARPPARTGAGRPSPGLAATAAVNYQRQPAAATTAARYQPQFTTAMTTAYFATAKGPLGHGEHLYRDVAGQTGLRWELLAACDWMQCKAHPRYSPVHGEKIGALNSDGTSYATKSAALGQCAARSDRARVGGVRNRPDRAAAAVGARAGRRLRRVPLGRAAAAARRLGDGVPLLCGRAHRAAPEDALARHRRPGRSRPAGRAVPRTVRRCSRRAQPRLPGNRLNGQKAQATPCPGSFPGSDAGPTPPLAPRPLPPLSR